MHRTEETLRLETALVDRFQEARYLCIFEETIARQSDEELVELTQAQTKIRQKLLELVRQLPSELVIPFSNFLLLLKEAEHRTLSEDEQAILIGVQMYVEQSPIPQLRKLINDIVEVDKELSVIHDIMQEQFLSDGQGKVTVLDLTEKKFGQI
jgi:hypothetical protein